MSHRNWFLTIIEKYLIPIVWTALFVSIVLTASTYLIDPVYSAKTELILDASIEHILPNMQDGTPSTSATDYIRQEYFAIDSINLMQQPEIGEKIIIDYGLVDNNGKKISINNFINPTITALIFSNNSQGITVKWISDTQQFSITGYGKDIHRAALLSSRYTDAFISYDKKQFNNILENLKERQEITLKTVTKKRLAVEEEQMTLRKKYGVADWETRLESLTAALATIERDIYSEEIEKSTIGKRLEELDKQAKELEVPVHQTETEKKNELLTTLQDSLTTFTQELAAIAVEFTPEHPEYKKIQERIDSVRQQMLNETKREYSQTTRYTSDALDSLLTNLMQAREDQVVRTVKLAKLHAIKNQYLETINYTGKGQALYNNLEEQKTGLTSILRAANQDIVAIESMLEKPFSFFRITAGPFIDLDNIEDARCLPQRKLTLLLSFMSILLLGLFYILVRELHLETLFYGWQLRQLPDGVESIDIVHNTKNNTIFASARHIFYSPDDTGRLIRIRKLDNTSYPCYIAKLGADFFSHAGESTLLVNNCGDQQGLECLKDKGLHSWLTGHLDEVTAGIQKGKNGYDILCDTHLNPDEPWVKTKNEIKELFSTLSRQYNNIVLIDPSLHSGRRLPGDVLNPDIDILTVRGGSLTVSQTLETVQHEKQTSMGRRTIILVMNDKESINLFSINGCFRLLFRFVKAPFEAISRKRV